MHDKYNHVHQSLRTVLVYSFYSIIIINSTSFHLPGLDNKLYDHDPNHRWCWQNEFQIVNSVRWWIWEISVPGNVECERPGTDLGHRERYASCLILCIKPKLVSLVTTPIGKCRGSKLKNIHQDNSERSKLDRWVLAKVESEFNLDMRKEEERISNRKSGINFGIRKV